MSNTIAVICSWNGLGHTRRQFLLCCELACKGFDVTLFTSQNAALYIDSLPTTSKLKINVISYTSQHSISRFDLSSTYFLNWLDSLPPLDPFDVVITDNHPEVLLLRKDAVINAQFFWHEVYADICSYKYRQTCTDLISNLMPTIYGSSLFSMTSIQNIPSFVPTYEFGPVILDRCQKPSDSRPNLLISIGNTDTASSSIDYILNHLLMTSLYAHFGCIYVEPRFFDDSWPSIFKPADYSGEMYRSLDFAIIRPGLGTILECLSNSVIIAPLCFNDNLEIFHNAKCIHNKFGFWPDMSLEFDKQLDSIFSFFLDDATSSVRNKFIENMSNIKFGGQIQIRNSICSNLLDIKS